ncbi:putative clathrin assembly protein [Vitis vinifera]|uniref:Putative clathrin assembly protein n=1 Tax=Vitis vinifera TaxID=29760 RepID=A0A438KE58_VITVI|nr:putative clathrin assembly protein [Vitis vinifera]
MKLWRRASGALKDKNSMLIASLSSRNAPWNPRFEVTIIKATSHDESKVDYENIKRVFAWLHASPAYLKPLLSALSTRLQKTCSWVVALKGLVLMHGVLRCNIPAVQNIGRLPFDLSNFRDSYRKSGRTWV